jgi:hypothetical protein
MPRESTHGAKHDEADHGEIDSGSIIKGVKRESTVPPRLRPFTESGQIGEKDMKPAGGGEISALASPPQGHFSIRESWMESSSRWATKCQEISLTTILRKVCLNAFRLVPESIGSGPRFGNVLSAYSL